MTNAQIANFADDILRGMLGPFGFERADVEDDFDHDGESAVRVTAHFKPGSKAADGKSALAALTALRTELRAAGEERFPFLRYDYPDSDAPFSAYEDANP